MQPSDKIIITGAAGLVGQNLILMLRERGFTNLTALDKRQDNARILRELNPGLAVVEADLAMPGAWADAFQGAAAVVQLHAQIGGEVSAEFVANNVTATQNVLDACRTHNVKALVHVSSSVVNSMAVDHYTETKKAQDSLVRASGIPFTALCPTLMFGWFDRKHLGWLARFMKKTPVFPVPGTGRYLRQPLYVRDFCGIIMACLARPPDNRFYNITGKENIDYIDMVRTLKCVTKAGAMIVRIPYALFWTMLKLYALIDPDPPFTVHQLKALATPDRFELIPWWEIFGVPATPFAQAITETFTDPHYADIVLKF